ncbi:hypothetical protein AAF143_09240 [Cyanobium sp. ATX-6F1]
MHQPSASTDGSRQKQPAMGELTTLIPKEIYRRDPSPYFVGTHDPAAASAGGQRSWGELVQPQVEG